MTTPIPLRSDFDGTALRRMARATKDADQARRFLALARIYDGGSRTEAALIGSVTLQIVRDWVVRFNARGPDGLVTGRAPGSRPKLGDEQRQALARMVESGPIPAIHGVVRWRRKDLAAWIFEAFGISLDETTVGRELKALGFAKLSARPRHHAQNELKLDAFKKTSRPSWPPSRPGSRAGPRSKSGGRCYEADPAAAVGCPVSVTSSGSRHHAVVRHHHPCRHRTQRLVVARRRAASWIRQMPDASACWRRYDGAADCAG